MELSQISTWAATAEAGDPWHWVFLESSAGKGSRDQFVIFVFLGALFCNVGWDNCPLYPYMVYLYLYVSVYVSLRAFLVAIFFAK
jgi:hypothetical protein